ncbi:terminase [Arthrobacter phage Conboy]|uniref:Terminase n=1 Tax=Arthrobacter phage Conboy TaxID=1873902 RepID=A0A1B1SFX1_9CAUD|nr:terminase [Arthrobacter phage Conboy]
MSQKNARARRGRTVVYDYTPHEGPQTFAHGIKVDELLYGGAAGGGKSRFMRADMFQFCMQVPGGRAIIFRRTFADLARSVIDPLLEETPNGLGRYNRSEHMWRFNNGSVLELGHLRNEADLLKYQGAEYQRIGFEELTHFTEKQYTYMLSRLRSAGDVKARMEALGLRTGVVATANPGGPGHHFVKQRFVDPAPAYKVFKMAASLEDPNPGTRCYIPAKATDNPSIDGSYIDRLNALDPNLRKALRDGDWNVLDGVRFAQWRESLHVVEPDISPMDLVTYPRVVAVDYGFGAPFAALWIAKLPNGVNLVYRELYAKNLTATQQAQMILDSEMDGERGPTRPIATVMDPSMWRRNEGGGSASPLGDKDAPPVGSAAHDYQRVMKQRPIRAYNARVPGWARIDELLRVQDDSGYPLLQVYDTCRDLIRTLPALPRDKKNPEDVDTTTEDHLPDALRYGAMFLNGRYYEPAKPQVKRSPYDSGRPATAGLARLGF